MLRYMQLIVLVAPPPCFAHCFYKPLSVPDDNSLSKLGYVARGTWRSPWSESAVDFLSAVFTFNAEVLLRELYSGAVRN